MKCVKTRKNGQPCDKELTHTEYALNGDTCCFHKLIPCRIPKCKNTLSRANSESGHAVCDDCKKKFTTIAQPYQAGINGSNAPNSGPAPVTSGQKIIIKVPASKVTKGQMKPIILGATPAVAKKAPVNQAKPIDKPFQKSANPCDCGSHILGYQPYKEGHSHWCSAHSSKKPSKN